jgi:hypothetical protein
MSYFNTISPITINPGPSQIGSVTVSNTVSISSSTIFAVVNTSAAGNTNALATLLAGPNQIGSVSISNSPTIGTGANWIGLVTASLVGTVNTGMTTLFPGPNQIGSVTIANQPPLIAGTAQIGSVTVSNTIGGIVTIAPRTDFIGSMTVTSTNPGSGGMTTIFPGPNQIGSVTIPHIVNSIATLAPRTDYIGLVTATQGNQPALVAGTAQIGSVTVSNIVNSIVTIAPRTDYIGLMTVTQGNQPALVASSAYIGLATTVNATSTAWIGLTTINSGRSMTTSMATVYSAAGNATLFVPPNGQRFFIHSLMINSQGNQNGNILSGTKPIWPFVGLATTGGFAMSFADPGLPARLADEALVLTINSAVTTSICAAIHFE